MCVCYVCVCVFVFSSVLNLVLQFPPDWWWTTKALEEVCWFVMCLKRWPSLRQCRSHNGKSWGRSIRVHRSVQHISYYRTSSWSSQQSVPVTTEDGAVLWLADMSGLDIILVISPVWVGSFVCDAFRCCLLQMQFGGCLLLFCLLSITVLQCSAGFRLQVSTHSLSLSKFWRHKLILSIFFYLPKDFVLCTVCVRERESKR